MIMIYAYDQWAQMPTKDIYDTYMMAMAINAAKDKYDERKKDLKDFEDKYADFYSPIQGDMTEYKNMMDNVRNVIDSAYERGIDVLRSPEGAAIIRQAQKMVDPNRVNFMKQRAENAAKWYANRDKLRAAGTYNEDFINSIGGSPEDWKSDFIGTTEVSPYLDYEQKYGHLFDKMGFEYDPEESAKHPGMLVSTKNKARMHDILSTAKTDLVNDPQYQYDLARMEAAIKEANPNVSNEDAVKQAVQALDNEIVERNYKGGMQMTEDPIAKEQRSYNNQVKLENLRYKHQKDLQGDKNKGETSYGLTLFTRGVKHSMTSTDPVVNQKSAYDFGRRVVASTNPQAALSMATGILPTRVGMANFNANVAGKVNAAFNSRYGRQNVETQQVFNNRFDKSQIVNGLVRLDESMYSRLYDPEEIYTNTLGYPSQNVYHTNTGRTASFASKTYTKSDAENGLCTSNDVGARMPVDVVVVGGDYTAPTKKHNYEQFVWVDLIRADGSKQRKGFKIYETDSVATIPDADGDEIAPYGYNLTPSQRSSNWWSQEDNRQNAAAGLGSASLHRGQDIILDTNM